MFHRILIQTPPTTSSLTLPPSRPPFEEGFRFRLPNGNRQWIIFEHWSTELPNHDDVISAIEKAEAELWREIKASPDRAIEARRGWNFQTAHIVVTNAWGEGGINHHELLGFLHGLRLFGQQFGFWTSDLTFWDARRSPSTRGRGRLEWARPPREGMATADYHLTFRNIPENRLGEGELPEAVISVIVVSTVSDGPVTAEENDRRNILVEGIISGILHLLRYLESPYYTVKTTHLP
ncbi:MAG: hypothetical protein Q9220_001850 [cf. Caloplaca sp. 1 TL-2023]